MLITITVRFNIYLEIFKIAVLKLISKVATYC